MIQTETDIDHTSSCILHSLVFGFFILNLIVHNLIKVPARANVNAFLRIGGLDTEHFKNLKISSPTSTPRDEACLPNGCLLALGEAQIGRNLGFNPERSDNNKRETTCNSKVVMLKLCNGTRFQAGISSENL